MNTGLLAFSKIGSVVSDNYWSVTPDKIWLRTPDANTGKYIDTTAAITIVEEDVFVPTLKIDVEAGKFKKYL